MNFGGSGKTIFFSALGFFLAFGAYKGIAFLTKAVQAYLNMKNKKDTKRVTFKEEEKEEKSGNNFHVEVIDKQNKKFEGLAG